MDNTIDKQVSNVLKKEYQKLSAEEENILREVTELGKLTGSISENYTIAPKDTIGRNVRYNVSSF